MLIAYVLIPKYRFPITWMISLISTIFISQVYNFITEIAWHIFDLQHNILLFLSYLRHRLRWVRMFYHFIASEKNASINVIKKINLNLGRKGKKIEVERKREREKRNKDKKRRRKGEMEGNGGWKKEEWMVCSRRRFQSEYIGIYITLLASVFESGGCRVSGTQSHAAVFYYW